MKNRASIKSVLSKNNERKFFLITAIGIILITASSFLFVGCSSEETTATSAYDTYVTEIKSSSQQSGGRAITNYQVIVKADADWANMSDEKRKELTDKAILECRLKASDADINEYNIIGTTENNETIFMYDRSLEQVIIYINGMPTGNIISAPGN
jgi:hypothetical protein